MFRLPRFYLACQRSYQTRVTFGLVLPCLKKHLATYIKPGKALSLRVEDIGRRRLLTPPRPGRQLPVVSAFRVSEGYLPRYPVPHSIPVTKSPTPAMSGLPRLSTPLCPQKSSKQVRPNLQQT